MQGRAVTTSASPYPQFMLLPGVDYFPLLATMLVIIQDDVAVPTIELAVLRRRNRYFRGTFDSPDLQRKEKGIHPFKLEQGGEIYKAPES